MSIQLLQGAQCIQQGAEACIYKLSLHPNQPGIILKHRFSKKYRHSSLDASLTKSRTIAEARSLIRCLRSQVSVPGLRMVDVAEGLLGIELIVGPSVKEVLEDAKSSPYPTNLYEKEPNTSEDVLMALIGTELAKMHKVDVIHGDLTTSNLLVRSRKGSQVGQIIVIIDFGLSYFSPLVEDKAVDLYVLERAFVSTHPNSGLLFSSILKAYEKASGSDWSSLKKRLDEVRLRGRKRSMMG